MRILDCLEDINMFYLDCKSINFNKSVCYCVKNNFSQKHRVVKIKNDNLYQHLFFTEVNSYEIEKKWHPIFEKRIFDCLIQENNCNWNCRTYIDAKNHSICTCLCTRPYQYTYGAINTYDLFKNDEYSIDVNINSDEETLIKEESEGSWLSNKNLNLIKIMYSKEIFKTHKTLNTLIHILYTITFLFFIVIILKFIQKKLKKYVIKKSKGHNIRKIHPFHEQNNINMENFKLKSYKLK